MICLNNKNTKLTNIYIMVILSVLASCKASQSRLSRFPKNQIVIGSYGGFTGMDINYIYLKNGGIYKTETLHGAKPKLSFVKKQSRKQSKAMFKAVRQISFQNVACAEPANINTYIEYRRLIFKDCYYQWGGLLDSTDKNFKAIKKLMQWQH